jgi:hypothetical protein
MQRPDCPRRNGDGTALVARSTDERSGDHHLFPKSSFVSQLPSVVEHNRIFLNYRPERRLRLFFARQVRFQNPEKRVYVKR